MQHTSKFLLAAALAAAVAGPAAAQERLQLGLSGVFAAGGSSEDETALAALQAGGHDPHRNGFTVQNVELSVGGAVDPYFDAQANVIFLVDADGETVVELEEAFFTTRALPWGLQIKGGQYLTEFGRHNTQHPHRWQFVDQPVALTQLLGEDGLRSQGARIAWLAPAPWYSEVYLGVQNARDLDGDGERLYSARWLNGADLSDTLSVNGGMSALWQTGSRTRGADLYLKWQPLRSQRGFPFVAWHTEFLSRDGDGTVLDGHGMFTQLLWGFRPRWVAGIRAGRASGDARRRESLNLTYYPSEFSKLRVQYNRERAAWLDGPGHALWLQYEFALGSHMAHTL